MHSVCRSGPLTASSFARARASARRASSAALHRHWSARVRSNPVEPEPGSRSERGACDNPRRCTIPPFAASMRLRLRSRRHPGRQHGPARRGLRSLHRAPRAAPADRGDARPPRRQAQPRHLPHPVRARALRRRRRHFADEKETVYRELSRGAWRPARARRVSWTRSSARACPPRSRPPPPRERHAHAPRARAHPPAHPDRPLGTVARGKPHPDVFLAAASSSRSLRRTASPSRTRPRASWPRAPPA